MKPIAYILILVVVSIVAFFVGRQFPRGGRGSTQPARQPTVSESTEVAHGPSEIFAALEALDADAVEALRGAAVGKVLHELVDYYWTLPDWDRKDLVNNLLSDFFADSSLSPVWEDALSSPNFETRALAVSGLSGDAVLFESFVIDSRVDAKRVDAAVEAYRASKVSSGE